MARVVHHIDLTSEIVKETVENVIQIDLTADDDGEPCSDKPYAARSAPPDSGHAADVVQQGTQPEERCAAAHIDSQAPDAPAKRQRTTQHAGEGAHGAGSAGADNDMLRRLHQERLARQQLLQQDDGIDEACVGHLPSHAGMGAGANTQEPTQEPAGVNRSQHAAGKGAGASQGHRATIQPASGSVAACLAHPSSQHAAGKGVGAGQGHHAAVRPAPGSGMAAIPRAGSGALAPTQPCTISILTYNLWFTPEVLRERMQGLVSILIEIQPDVLMFQEVIPEMLEWMVTDNAQLFDMYDFCDADVMGGYFTVMAYRRQTVRPLQLHQLQRVPFTDKNMGRDVAWIPLSVVGNPSAPPILVATSHLESPMGRPKHLRYWQERERQLEEGCEVLTDRAAKVAGGLPRTLQEEGQPAVDIVWAGDMNWNNDNICEPKLPETWQDVWATHRPEELGATYDPQTNTNLKGVKYPPGRLDRFFARLDRWHFKSVELVGTQPIPGLKATIHFKRVDNVLVSDHYGVLLKLTWPGATAVTEAKVTEKKEESVESVPQVPWEGRARNWGKPRG